MANYNTLKSTIADVVKQNGNNEITGALLQQALLSMINSLGAGFQFIGVATPGMDPGIPDPNVFYFAAVAGVYRNFGGIVAGEGEFTILKYNGSWSKSSVPIPGSESLQKAIQDIGNLAELRTEDKDNLVESVNDVFEMYEISQQEMADFEQTIRNIIEQYRPIIIDGDVVNAPDEEDLTSVNDLLKFANRNSLNGLGYVILRRGKTFAEQVTLVNTIYEVRYNFDLNGATVNIPAGCVLNFVGGRLSNGTLALSDTFLLGKNGLGIDLLLTGTCGNSLLQSDVYAMGKTGNDDVTIAVQSLVNVCRSTLLFAKGIYKMSRVESSHDITIDGGYSIFRSAIPLVPGHPAMAYILAISNCDNCIVKNIQFEGNNVGVRNQTVPTEPLLWVYDVRNVQITSCKFSKFRAGKYPVEEGENEYNDKGPLTITGAFNVEVENCEFYDIKWVEWLWITPSPNGGSFITDDSRCKVTGCHFHQPKNSMDGGKTPVNLMLSNIDFSWNIVEDFYYTGSLVNLFGYNVVARNNIIRAYGTSAVDTCEWGQFYNNSVVFENNEIELNNGVGLVFNSRKANISGNVISGIGGVRLENVKQSTIVRPTGDEYVNDEGICEFVRIADNKFDMNLFDPTYIDGGGTVIATSATNAVRINMVNEVGQDVIIENNNIVANTLPLEIPRNRRQPIYVYGVKGSVDIRGNRCVTDILSVVSGADLGFIYLYNMGDYTMDVLSVKENIINTTLSPSKGCFLVIDAEGVNRIKDVAIAGNRYIGSNGELYNTIYQRRHVIEHLSLFDMGKTDLSRLTFSAIELDSDFVIPITRIPSLNSLYVYSLGNLRLQIPVVDDKKCFAVYESYATAGAAYDLRGKTLDIGSIVRVDANTVYMLLNGPTTFGDTIPEVTEKTNNSITTWNGVSWLVLTRYAPNPLGVVARSENLQGLDSNVRLIAVNPNERVLTSLLSGVLYDFKGWRNLGIRGNTSAMNSLGVTGGDEGYLFYNTDIKMWCQLYIDRSGGGVKLCWQVLGSGRGETAKRPTVLTKVFGVGFTYYDTDLSKPIVWNGTTWVNMDGTALA